ncbi:hypothetical protein SDC9_180916 [bioreactor metagenome]|uniref:Uncharacterized protein n=1 Tax=bioreactor metagenome TaxID=1076179 RepID=A0A645H5S8_9ZZZZ
MRGAGALHLGAPAHPGRQASGHGDAAEKLDGQQIVAQGLHGVVNKKGAAFAFYSLVLDTFLSEINAGKAVVAPVFYFRNS